MVQPLLSSLTMTQPPSYLFVSLPSSIVPSSHKDDALQSIQTAIEQNNGTVQSLSIPEFKIGTLDALVQQADELGKLDNTCLGVVAKIGDALSNILDGDKRKTAESKKVDDSKRTLYRAYSRAEGSWETLQLLMTSGS